MRRLELLHLSTRRRFGALQLDEVRFDLAERTTCPSLVRFGVVQAVPRRLDFGQRGVSLRLGGGQLCLESTHLARPIGQH